MSLSYERSNRNHDERIRHCGKKNKVTGKHQVENYEVETTVTEVRIQLAGLKRMEMGEEEGK